MSISTSNASADAAQDPFTYDLFIFQLSVQDQLNLIVLKKPLFAHIIRDYARPKEFTVRKDETSEG